MSALERPATVVVTSRSFSSGTVDLGARLEAAGLEVVRCPPDHTLDVLAPPLAHACAWIAGTAPVTAVHLERAPALQVLARYGVGTDAVDLRAAAALGIVVTNTPGANSSAVAEHAVALLFAALRRVPAGDRRVRAGDWSVTRGRQLAGSTAGVVGFGRIGRSVADKLAALGCRVRVHDPFVRDQEILESGHRSAGLAELVSSCRVVSLHAPGGDVLVDAGWIDSCASGQVLVNTARAALVDEHAVAQGLRSGALAGYAADTLRTEAGAETASPLLHPALADLVVVTPHLGAQTSEAVDLMGTMTVEDVLAVLGGREPANPVLPDPPRADR